MIQKIAEGSKPKERKGQSDTITIKNGHIVSHLIKYYNSKSFEHP
jgi:hypothetical protein